MSQDRVYPVLSGDALASYYKATRKNVMLSAVLPRIGGVGLFEISAVWQSKA